MKIRNGGTRPGVWCEPRRAGRGDVDMPDVHDDSAAADDEPWPAALFTKPRQLRLYVDYT